MCDIDYKMHAIVAGKKRSVLQSIQEETATNIYMPSPLQGLVGPDISATSGAALNLGTIWITGEFFGVQRARDMLFQVSVNKVRCVVVFVGFQDLNISSEQDYRLSGYSHTSSQVGLDGHRPRR